jgi:hypothetical protein
VMEPPLRSRTVPVIAAAWSDAAKTAALATSARWRSACGGSGRGHHGGELLAGYAGGLRVLAEQPTVAPTGR